MAIAKTIGSRVSQARKAKGFSQAKLAEMAMLDRSFISEIENGKTNISIVVLEKIANALGVSMASLLGESDSENPKY